MGRTLAGGESTSLYQTFRGLDRALPSGDIRPDLRYILPMPLAYGFIEPTDLALPHVPPALDGIRIAHVSDLHVRHHRRIYERMINQLANVRLNMLVLTGDYMTSPGDEKAAVDVLARLTDRLHPAVSCFGVFGNHDSNDLREAVNDLPVVWLQDEVVAVESLPIDVLGMNASNRTSVDVVAVAQSLAGRFCSGTESGAANEQRLRIALSHFPQFATIAADLGADVIFSGHTHGGQIRLPGGRALVNSCDLPNRLTSGVLRHQNMMLAISRGVGTRVLPLRLFCPPHVPLYTIHRAALMGRYTDDIDVLLPW